MLLTGAALHSKTKSNNIFYLALICLKEGRKFAREFSMMEFNPDTNLPQDFVTMDKIKC